MNRKFKPEARNQKSERMFKGLIVLKYLGFDLDFVIRISGFYSIYLEIVSLREI